MKRWNATLGSWVHEGVNLDAFTSPRSGKARGSRKRPRSECSICFAAPASYPAVCRPCRHVFCGKCAVEVRFARRMGRVPARSGHRAHFADTFAEPRHPRAQWLNRAPTCPLCRCAVSRLADSADGRTLWSAPAPCEQRCSDRLPAAATAAAARSVDHMPERRSCTRTARLVRAPPRRRRSGDGPVPRQRSPPADPVAWRRSISRRQCWAVPPPAGRGRGDSSRGLASPAALASLCRGRVPARLSEWALREVHALTGASCDAVLEGAVRQLLLDRPCASLHAQPCVEEAVGRGALPRWRDVAAWRQQHCAGRRQCLARWRAALAAWLPEQRLDHFTHELRYGHSRARPPTLLRSLPLRPGVMALTACAWSLTPSFPAPQLLRPLGFLGAHV